MFMACCQGLKGDFPELKTMQLQEVYIRSGRMREAKEAECTSKPLGKLPLVLVGLLE
jgi:hypothetical protein